MARVLITGASKGIGFASALAFARAGHEVLATMRSPAGAPALGETAVKEGLPIAVSTMNVDQDDSVRDGISAMLERGPIDVLVNNAGVEVVGAIEELALAQFRAVMETNYFGALRCIQAVVPAMRMQGSGCVINVSSIAGELSCPPLTGYCASKWALEALSEALACEMKPFGVRVALVQPGVIDTAMAQRIAEPGSPSPYNHTARFAVMFSASLKTPVSPAVVADKIVEVATNGTSVLRHPVGPDASPMIGWRRQMTDEEWIQLNGGDDATFFASLGM